MLEELFNKNGKGKRFIVEKYKYHDGDNDNFKMITFSCSFEISADDNIKNNVSPEISYGFKTLYLYFERRGLISKNIG
jgi:hypothetical protein